jgi:hypothetical protein
MKMMRWFLLGMIMVAGIGFLKADVATEGEVDVRVELMNADAFAGYQFFIRYQSYSYNMGYHKGELNDVFLESGKHIETGGRGDASLLYARDKNGKEFVSKLEVGGVKQGQSRDVAYILDQIEVTGIKKGVIKFKVVSTKKIGDNGEVIEVLKGGIEPNWLMLLLPASCLIGLMIFFVVRRRLGKAAVA